VKCVSTIPSSGAGNSAIWHLLGGRGAVAWEGRGEPRPYPVPHVSSAAYRKRKIGGQLMITPLEPNRPPLGPVMWPWAASPRMRNSSKLRER
jgi:hypothetical protein